MKTKIFFAFLLSAFCLMLDAAVLDFELSVQEHDQWCWAGASQSILHYYGLPITQTEIAQYGTEGSNTWNWLYGSSENPTRRGISMILDNFAGLKTISSDFASTPAVVVAEIDSLQPFVTRIGWTYGGGHFIDCYGYNLNNLYLMDPWPGNGFTVSDYYWYLNGSPDFTWTHTLIMNSEVGLKAYFKATPPDGYAPLNVTFTNYSLGNPTTWNWDFNNDGITDSNLPNPNYNYIQHNAYQVNLTVTKGTQTNTFGMVINAYDNPPEIINPMPDIWTRPNQTVTGINLNNVFADADNDSLFFNFFNSQNHITGSIVNGMLTLIPQQDWTGTTVCFVRCEDNYLHTINDIFNVIVSDSTAVEDNVTEIAQPEMTVYPNPFHSLLKVNVKNPCKEPLVMTLFNLKGQKIDKWNIDANTDKEIAINSNQINKPNLTPGVYFLNLDSKIYHNSRKVTLFR